MKREFSQAIKIIQILEEQGHEAYFVGGSVRDYLMKRELGDIDIATSATPEQIQSIFPKTIDVGAAHGTIIVVTIDNTYEVTTFRTEGSYSDFRRPDEVTFIKSLVEDLKRRDFTMNAIAMTQTGEIKDPFLGQQAIERKLIITVGEASERFREDALRMLRAIRFTSQLSFSLDKDTLNAIQKDASLLQQVSVERKTIELEKLLLGSGLKNAMPLLIQSQLFHYLPHLQHKKDELLQLSQYPLSSLSHRSELWTALAFILKVRRVESFLEAWKLPKKLIKDVNGNVEAIERYLQEGWTKELVYRAGWDTCLEAHHVLEVIGKATQSSLTLIQQLHKELPIQSIQDIALNGNELVEIVGKKPGKWIAIVLGQLEKQILEGNIVNEATALEEWVRSWQQKYGQNY